MWGGQVDVKPIESSGLRGSEIMYIQIPNLVFKGVFKATLITLCFIPTHYLEINKLNFVVGHGTAVQLGYPTIRL